MLVGAHCEATVEKPPETNMIGGKSENNSFRGKEIRKKSLEILVLPLHLSMNHPFSFFGGVFAFQKRQRLPPIMVEKNVWLGIAATSWRLSAWKISRSYWKRQRWKGSESRPRI